MKMNLSSISKWNEIDIEMFKELFERFWNGGYDDYVLEVAGLMQYSITRKKASLFFGRKIDIRDYPEWNTESIKVLKEILSSEGFKSEYKISSVMLSDGIHVSPLALQEHYDLVWWTWFGGEKPEGLSLEGRTSKLKLPFWYYKEGDTRVLPFYFQNEDLRKKIDKTVLVRILEFDVWKEYMKDYVNQDYTVPDEWLGDTFPNISGLIQL